MRRLGTWITAGLLCTACVEQPPKKRDNNAPSQAQLDNIRKRVVSDTEHKPGPEENYFPVNAKFGTGNKVTLLGYSLTPRLVRKNMRVTITWYWKCNSKLDAGWHLFTHLDDATTAKKNLDEVGEARVGYQPDRWRPGEYITDEQTFELDGSWDSPTARLMLGLWRNDARMEVIDPGKGKMMPDGRFEAASIETGEKVEVSALAATKTATAPTIDGKLDEPMWATAASTNNLVDPITGALANPESNARGNVRMLWDDSALYLAWDVTDDNLVETGDKRDSQMWKNDTTEVLIDPNGDGKDYYEIQITPGNHIFDSQQPQPPQGENFGNTSYDAPLRSAVALKGTSTVGKADDVDEGYTVEVAIPWSALSTGAAHVPPLPGDEWRMNFFLMDVPKPGGMRQSAWSAPRSGSFHAYDHFGRVTFVAGPETNVVVPNALQLINPDAALGPSTDAAVLAVQPDGSAGEANMDAGSTAPPVPAASDASAQPVDASRPRDAGARAVRRPPPRPAAR